MKLWLPVLAGSSAFSTTFSLSTINFWFSSSQWTHQYFARIVEDVGMQGILRRAAKTLHPAHILEPFGKTFSNLCCPPHFPHMYLHVLSSSLTLEEAGSHLLACPSCLLLESFSLLGGSSPSTSPGAPVFTDLLVPLPPFRERMFLILGWLLY